MEIILRESYVFGTSYTFVYTLSLFAVFFSVYIIVSKNPIISVLFLIGLFFSISLYLITIGLQFLGLVYLIVYVGAVSILFLFILMLINVRISELLTDNNNSILLAVFVILCINYSTQDILPFDASFYDIFSINVLSFVWNIMDNTFALSNNNNDSFLYLVNYINFVGIAATTSKSWDNIIVSLSHVTSIGNVLYTNLSILFIITSLILLLAMIGAIIITINKTTNKSNLNTNKSPYMLLESKITIDRVLFKKLLLFTRKKNT